MTPKQTKRCQHCKITYGYQVSGEGCFDKLNDDTYCPICKNAINDALSKIPIKIKKSWEITDEVTYDYLKEKRDEQDKKACGLCSRRVYVSLFSKDDHEKNDAFEVDGKEYIVKYWTKKPDDFTIEVAKEKHILTGEIGDYWHDY